MYASPGPPTGPRPPCEHPPSLPPVISRPPTAAADGRALFARPDRPLRVLHVSRPVDGGVARVVADLVRAAPAAGLHPTVACPPDGPLAAAVRDAGGAVRHWPATRRPDHRLADEVRRLSGIVAAVRPDVVHAHGARAGLAARLAVRGRIPTVYQPYAWPFEAAEGPSAALVRSWERYAARWADRIVCGGEAERRAGRRAGIRAVWAVVPTGVDTARFRPSPAPAADRRAALPLHPDLAVSPDPAGPPVPGGRLPGANVSPVAADPTDRPLVVCVARLCRRKGQDVLLRAWPEVLRRLPGARLVLVGDGPDEAALRATAPAAVTLAGPTVDPAAWYRVADLVVLPSRRAGLGLVPLEAMACGRVVLRTDVDGARERLPPDHAPHCLVPPDDPYGLARAVLTLLYDAPLRAALGRSGRQYVVARHDVRHAAATTAALYRTVLPDGGHGPAAHPARARRWAGTDGAR